MPNDNLKLLQIIKQAAEVVIGESMPADFPIGIVTAIDPLEIQLENKLPIPAENLILTKNTSLWSVDLTVNHKTDDAAGGSGYAQYESHHHGYTGTKTFLVHNELAVGDQVILARAQGGQRFIVLDRYYNPDRGCND